MSNQELRTPLGDISSPECYASRLVAGINIHGDYSGNSGSYNTINSNNVTNNHYYNQGGTNSSPSYAEILQCLYTSRYELHRNRVREPVNGTCIWVTEHPKYKDWLGNRTSGPLWLSADPGCGKSVIASFLVNHLKNRADATVCYFFFKDDNEEQRSATFALSAILHQLFSQNKQLCRYAEEALKAKGKQFTEEVDTLWDILVTAVAEGCSDVICVVDALDECEDVTLARLIRHITRAPVSQLSDIPLKFFVTSRPYHKIERDLGSPQRTIRLGGEEEVNAITTDVSRVIGEGVEGLESYWGKPGELKYLRGLLESSADRTFLWVSLVLEILRDSVDDSREGFTNLVSTAPRDLPELYTKILNKSVDPDKARRILHIVVAAARPLTLREMNVAFKIRQRHKTNDDIEDLSGGFDRTVKNLCGLFVRVIDSKIYLVHQTAREFLIKGSSSGQGNWQYSLCFEDSNYILAEICISYLSFEEFEKDPLGIDIDDPRSVVELTRYKEKYALLDYAASYWADHFRDAQAQQKKLFELTQQICEGGSKRFLTWLKVYWETCGRYYPFPIDFTNLMIASWLGQRTIVERLLEEGGNINARSNKYGTALNIAALREDGDMTGMLAKRMARACVGGKEYNIVQTKRSDLDENLEEEWMLLEDRKERLLEDRREWRPFEERRLEYDLLKASEFLRPFCIQDTPDPNTSLPHTPDPHVGAHARDRPASTGCCCS